MHGEGLRADTAAPAGADDGDFDRFHQCGFTPGCFNGWALAKASISMHWL
jgi:hypothetical protein